MRAADILGMSLTDVLASPNELIEAALTIRLHDVRTRAANNDLETKAAAMMAELRGRHA